MSFADAWGHMDGWGWMWMWGVAVMAAWVLVAVAALRWLTSGRTPSNTPPPAAGGSLAEARAVLARRFAAGEIDEAEYRRRLAVLNETDR